MKLIGFTLLYLAISVQVLGQVRLQGKITDTSRIALPYANIGFVGTQVGTVSDRNGLFELIYNVDEITPADTLRISMTGYKPITLIASELRCDKFISLSLEKSITHIDEIVVVAQKVKKKRIGSFNISALNMSCNFALSDIPAQNLGAEVARRFHIGKRKAKINTVRFFIAHNNFDTVGFRINIYTLRNNLPYSNLLTQNIIVEVKENRLDRKRS